MWSCLFVTVRNLKVVHWLLGALFSVISAAVVQANELVIKSQERAPVFVELYTSQGCYSCPPAERWMNKLQEQDGLWERLIPINLHVDYWDYIGWRDPFARKEFSSRQRKYNRFGHTRNVATPGFVVNGQGWGGWFRGQSLPEPLESFSGLLEGSLQTNKWTLRYDSDQSALKRLNVHAALLGFGIETAVPRGENAGKTLAHDFVVIGYQRGRMERTESGWSKVLDTPEAVPVEHSRQAIVFWVTSEDDPKPLQVMAGWL